MKRLLIFMWCLFLATIGLYADEQHRIKLNEKHTKESIGLAYCKISVTEVDSDDEGNAKVTVEIENLDESNILIIFDRAYAEKELKKLSPSITYDKKFPGTKGQREIVTYKESRRVLFIEPSEKIALPEITVRCTEPQLCILPLYIAKYKGKRTSKILLIEKQILELEIKVEEKVDEDYIRIEKEYIGLIDDMGKLTFCNNPLHRPTLDRQEAPFKEKINKIRYEIDSILTLHNKWFSRDRRYLRYDSLKRKLSEIDFVKYERDCGNSKNHKPNPPRPRHSCKYCNYTLQQIYEKLESFYMKIYNRQVTKQEVIADVNLLYKCCVDGNCNKHASLWNGSVYKSGIIEYYNRIKNF